jgi:RimJ/RimL family protein N-acetyltransferase
MFVFGGASPGWGNIRPTCPAPPDCWSYSLAENKWDLLYAGPGTPKGYAMACCYDSKRDVVWAYGRESRLSRFDLKTRTWSAHAVHPTIDYVGLYNFHMLYLPKSDKILLVGDDTCTIDPQTLVSHRHRLNRASGKAGLAYLPEQDAVLYVSLPGGETGPEYRTEVFDCAKTQGQKAETWVERQVNRYARHGHGLWLVLDRASGQPVGQAGLLIQNVEGVEEKEVGYLIHRPFWRRGFATEAALACRNYAFDALGRQRVPYENRDPNRLA